ncbi:cytochrome P450 [Lentinula detonsa]|uniref:Cytochrome P450 n=1 Tax=Lentinula detonsa TaxID=2804962 RepID=A0A9W8NYX9_9AGAR|nr:cytochrome P450 [Lentinula detonsa]
MLQHTIDHRFLLFLAFPLGFLVFWYRFFRRRGSLPPGPPAWPIVGNLFHFPLKDLWTSFKRLRSAGDMVYFHGLGHSVLILNNLEDIQELFHRRGQNYSNRPHFTVASDMMGLDQSLPLMSLGKAMNLHRRLARTVLNQEIIKKYHPVQEDVAALMAESLLQNPDNFAKTIRLATARIITTVTYGFSLSHDDDEYMNLADSTMEVVNQAIRLGAHLVDAIPFFKYAPSWLPFSPHEDVKKAKAMIDRLVNSPFQGVKNEIESGTARTSFICDCLHDRNDVSEPTEEYEHAVKWAAAAMYVAGGETTHVTLMAFIIAMALNPEKQILAQEELDRVVGPAALPVIADRASLPMVNAIIKETLRWHPALPLGLAHVSAQDDAYKGYFIPAGTIVVPNVCSLASGEVEIHDRSTFNPERFLNHASETSFIDPSAYAFGFGRRLCPGKPLAEASLFILVATILSSFEIRLPLDSNGHEIPIDPKFQFGFVSHPQEFHCTFTVRSAGKAQAIAKRAAQSTV